MRLFNSGRAPYDPQGLVLDVAAGQYPVPEAHVCLEPEIKSVTAVQKNTTKKAVLGNILDMPFRDQSFGYVVCLHLFEHLEKQEIQKAETELARVAPRGYIEVPSLYWELLHNCDRGFMYEDQYNTHHKQYCFLDGNTLVFIRKKEGFYHTNRILREMFRSFLGRMINQPYIDLLYIGLAWEKAPQLQFYDSWDDVPPETFQKILDQPAQYIKKRNGLPWFQKTKEELHRRFNTMVKPRMNQLQKVPSFVLEDLLKK